MYVDQLVMVFRYPPINVNGAGFMHGLPKQGSRRRMGMQPMWTWRTCKPYQGERSLDETLPPGLLSTQVAQLRLGYLAYLATSSSSHFLSGCSSLTSFNLYSLGDYFCHELDVEIFGTPLAH